MLEVRLPALGELVERPFDTRAVLLHFRFLQPAGNVNPLAVDEESPRERERDFEAVPRAEKFFFCATNATGMIGRPVAWAI